MSSGYKEMQVNTQERAISTDINRLQRFAHADVAEMWRFMIDASFATDDLDAAAVMSQFATQANPLRAEVINGLMVRPQTGAGVLDLFVDPGLLMAVDPDAIPTGDDSVYKYVRDVGVTTVGQLVMTGGGGATRVDVIECQRVDAVVETDNRDIFNPVTGLFSATGVTKARQSRLNYRVRAGTAGSGYPGTAQGWLPLAIVSVPAGATSNDQMTFWDVRPLLADRLFNISNLTTARPMIGRNIVNARVLTAVGGRLEAELGMRRLGGRLRRGSPGTDAQTIDLTDAANRENGFTAVLARPWYVYLCTPFGLPRWARYTDGPGLRVPRSPRGIPLVSMTSCDANGQPTSALALPSGMGLGSGTVQTTEAAVVSSSWVATGPTVRGYTQQRGTVFFAGSHENTKIANTDGTGLATFTFTAGVDYPTNAQELIIDASSSLGSGSAVNGSHALTLKVYNGSDVVSQPSFSNVAQIMGQLSPASGTIGGNVTIPVPTPYPTATGSTFRIDALLSTVGDLGSQTVQLSIVGWNLV